MATLDWDNPNYFLNQSYPFQQFHFQNPEDIFISSPIPSFDNETDFLCFDHPTLFDFDEPVFDPLPLQNLDFNPELFTPNINTSYSPLSYDEFPVITSNEEILSFDQDFSNQFIPFAKKQKLSGPIPCFNGFVPEFYVDYRVDHNYDHNYNPNYDYNYNGNEGGGSFNEDNNNNGSNGGGKAKTVSAQSRAARERRRRITEKTQELGKLIPGGNKLNTAEMFQAASKYVKFMQAQLEILQSLKSFQEDSNKDIKSNNLPILSSQIVQEKLYSKEKCLIPLEFLTILDEHCDSEADPSISQQIKELLH